MGQWDECAGNGGGIRARPNSSRTTLDLARVDKLNSSSRNAWEVIIPSALTWSGAAQCLPLFGGYAPPQLRVLPGNLTGWHARETEHAVTNPLNVLQGAFRLQRAFSKVLVRGNGSLLAPPAAADSRWAEVWTPSLEELDARSRTAAGEPCAVVPPVLLPVGVSLNATCLWATGRPNASEILASRHLVVRGGAARAPVLWSDALLTVLESGDSGPVHAPASRVLAVVQPEQRSRVWALTLLATAAGRGAGQGPSGGAGWGDGSADVADGAGKPATAAGTRRAGLVVARGSRLTVGGVRHRRGDPAQGGSPGVAGQAAACAAGGGAPRTRVTAFGAPGWPRTLWASRDELPLAASAGAEERRRRGVTTDASRQPVLPTLQLLDHLPPAATNGSAGGRLFVVLDLGFVFLGEGGEALSGQALPPGVEWLDVSVRVNLTSEGPAGTGRWLANGSLDSRSVVGIARGAFRLNASSAVGPCDSVVANHLLAVSPGLCARLAVNVLLPGSPAGSAGHSLLAGFDAVAWTANRFGVSDPLASAGEGKVDASVLGPPSTSPSPTPTPSTSPSPSTPPCTSPSPTSASPSMPLPSGAAPGVVVSAEGAAVFASDCCNLTRLADRRFGSAMALLGDIDGDGNQSDVAVVSFGANAGPNRSVISLLSVCSKNDTGSGPVVRLIRTVGDGIDDPVLPAAQERVSLAAVNVTAALANGADTALYASVTLLALGVYGDHEVTLVWLGTARAGGEDGQSGVHVLNTTTLSVPDVDGQEMITSVALLPPPLLVTDSAEHPTVALFVGVIGGNNAHGKVQRFDLPADWRQPMPSTSATTIGPPSELTGNGSDASKFGQALAIGAGLGTDSAPDPTSTRTMWVSAPGSNGNSLVEIRLQGFDDQNPNVWKAPTLGSNAELGMSLALPGDLDGDGRPDLVAGANSCIEERTACVVVLFRGHDASAGWRHIAKIFSSDQPGYNLPGVDDGFGGSLAALPGLFREAGISGGSVSGLLVARPRHKQPPDTPQAGSLLVLRLGGRPAHVSPTPSVTPTPSETPSPTSSVTAAASPSPSPSARPSGPSNPSTTPSPRPGAGGDAPKTDAEQEAERRSAAARRGVESPVTLGDAAPRFAVVDFAALQRATQDLRNGSAAPTPRGAPTYATRVDAPGGGLFRLAPAGSARDTLAVCSTSSVDIRLASGTTWALSALDLGAGASLALGAVTGSGCAGALSGSGAAGLAVTVDVLSSSPDPSRGVNATVEAARVCVVGLESLVESSDPVTGDAAPSDGRPSGSALLRTALGLEPSAQGLAAAQVAGPRGLGARSVVLESALVLAPRGPGCSALPAGTPFDAPTILVGLGVVLPALRVAPLAVDRTVNVEAAEFGSAGPAGESTPAPSRRLSRAGGNGSTTVARLSLSNGGATALDWAVALSGRACWAGVGWAEGQSTAPLGGGPTLPPIGPTRGFDPACPAQSAGAAESARAAAGATGVGPQAEDPEYVTACGTLAGEGGLAMRLTVGGLDSLPPASYRTALVVAASDPSLPRGVVEVPWTLRLTALAVCPSSAIEADLAPSGSAARHFAAVAAASNRSWVTRHLLHPGSLTASAPSLAVVLAEPVPPSEELLQRIQVSNLGGSTARVARVWVFAGGRLNEEAVYGAAAAGANGSAAGGEGGSACAAQFGGGTAEGAVAALRRAVDAAVTERGTPPWVAVALDDAAGTVRADAAGRPLLEPGSTLRLLVAARYDAATLPGAVASGTPGLRRARATVAFELEEASPGIARRVPEIRQIEVDVGTPTGRADPAATLVFVPPSSSATAVSAGLVAAPSLAASLLVAALRARSSPAAADLRARTYTLPVLGAVGMASSLPSTAFVVLPRDSLGVPRLVASADPSSPPGSPVAAVLGGADAVTALSAAPGAPAAGSATPVLLRPADVRASGSLGDPSALGAAALPAPSTGMPAPAVVAYAVSVGPAVRGIAAVTVTLSGSAAAFDVLIDVPAPNCSLASGLAPLSGRSSACGCAPGSALTSNASVIGAAVAAAASSLRQAPPRGAAAVPAEDAAAWAAMGPFDRLSPWLRTAPASGPGNAGASVLAALSAACERCPPGAVSAAPTLLDVGEACSVCPAGTYAGAASSACLPCPSRGALCEGGLLFALPGWWVDTAPAGSAPAEAAAGAAVAGGRALADAPAEPARSVPRLYLCPLAGACNVTGSLSGDVSGRLVATADGGGDALSAADDTDGCTAGHRGPLCGECSGGFAHSPFTAGVRAPCVACGGLDALVLLVACACGFVWSVWLTTLWAWGAAPAADIITGLVDVRSIPAAGAEARVVGAAAAAGRGGGGGGNGTGTLNPMRRLRSSPSKRVRAQRAETAAAGVVVIQLEAASLVRALARTASVASRALVALQAVAAAQIFALAVDAQPGAAPVLTRWLRLAAEVVGFGLPVTSHHAACTPPFAGLGPADAFLLAGPALPVLCLALFAPASAAVAFLLTAGRRTCRRGGLCQPPSAPPGDVAPPTPARFMMAALGVWATLTMPRAVTLGLQYSAAVALPLTSVSEVEPAIAASGVALPAGGEVTVLQMATSTAAGSAGAGVSGALLAGAPWVAAVLAGAGMLCLVLCSRWAAAAVVRAAKQKPTEVSFSAGVARRWGPDVASSSVGAGAGALSSLAGSASRAPAGPGQGTGALPVAGGRHGRTGGKGSAGALPAGAGQPEAARPGDSDRSGGARAADATQGAGFRRGVPAAFALTWPAWALVVHRSKPRPRLAVWAGMRDVAAWWALRLLVASAGMGMTGGSSQYTLGCGVVFLLYAAAAARGHCDRRLTQLPRTGPESVLVRAERAARSLLLLPVPPPASDLVGGRWLGHPALEEAWRAAEAKAEQEAAASPGTKHGPPGAIGAAPGRPGFASAREKAARSAAATSSTILAARMGVLPSPLEGSGTAVASQTGATVMDDDRARAARAILPGLPHTDALAAAGLAGAALVDGLLLVSWWLRGADDGVDFWPVVGAFGVAAVTVLALACVSATRFDRAAVIESRVCGRGIVEESEEWRLLLPGGGAAFIGSDDDEEDDADAPKATPVFVAEPPAARAGRSKLRLSMVVRPGSAAGPGSPPPLGLLRAGSPTPTEAAGSAAQRADQRAAERNQTAAAVRSGRGLQQPPLGASETH